MNEGPVPAVLVRGIAKQYPAPRPLRSLLRQRGPEEWISVLHGLDLEVASGEVVGIMGANGAGKTTLLKVIAGLIRPDAGSVSVFGLDLDTDERALRALCAYVHADERSFYWRLTGRQNLEFFAALEDLDRRSARELIAELAARLQISAYLDRPFSHYSTGIRQRFSLARALQRRPRLLLLDEPTRSLDPDAAADVWQIVRDLVTPATAVLIVTHHESEAAAVCDRVLTLNDGVVSPPAPRAMLPSTPARVCRLRFEVEGLPRDWSRRLNGVEGVMSARMVDDCSVTTLEVWCESREPVLHAVIRVVTGLHGSIVAIESETDPDVMPRQELLLAR